MQMQQGDLMYLPQDVYLYSTDLKYRTEKPLTALYLSEKKESSVLQILVDGVTMNVRKNHVYPLKETQNVS